MLRNKFRNRYQDTLLESRDTNYPDGQLGSRSKKKKPHKKPKQNHHHTKKPLSRSMKYFLPPIAAFRSSPRMPVLT